MYTMSTLLLLQLTSTVTLLISLLSLTLANPAPKPQHENGHAVVVIDDYADDYGLVCHHCYRSIHGDDCVTMHNQTNIERQICDDDQIFCQVEWLKTDDMLTTFTRGCSKSCKPGCESAGDLYQLERCFHCCKGDLCNEEIAAANACVLSRWVTTAVAIISGCRIFIKDVI